MKLLLLDRVKTGKWEDINTLTFRQDSRKNRFIDKLNFAQIDFTSIELKYFIIQDYILFMTEKNEKIRNFTLYLTKYT